MAKGKDKGRSRDTEIQDHTRLLWEEQRTLGLSGDMVLEREPTAQNLGTSLGNPASGWWSNAWVPTGEKEENE